MRQLAGIVLIVGLLLTSCTKLSGTDFPQERESPEYNLELTTFPAVPLLWDDANVYVTC